MNDKAIICVRLIDDPIQSWINTSSVKLTELTDHHLTAFDFDNFSDLYTIDLAVKLVSETKKSFIQIEVMTDNADMKVVKRFFSVISRKHPAKSRVIFNQMLPELRPYLSLLGARQSNDAKAVKTEFEAWINE